MIRAKGASRINEVFQRSQDGQMAFRREGLLSNQQARAG